MEENKTIEPATNKVDHLKPIKDDVDKLGIKMPDLVATGDLTVEKKEEVVIVENDADTDKVKKSIKNLNKKDIPLPEMGAKFMLHGHEYKVVYINEGQHRFSCEPCKGIY